MRGATRARTSVGEFRESTNVLCWGGKKIIFFAKKDPASVARFLKIFCISNGVLIIRHYINCLCNWCQHGNEGANGKFSRLIFVRRGIISSLKYIRLYCIAAARRRHERYTIDRSTKVHAWLQNRKRERERARKKERKKDVPTTQRSPPASTTTSSKCENNLKGIDSRSCASSIWICFVSSGHMVILSCRRMDLNGQAWSTTGIKFRQLSRKRLWKLSRIHPVSREDIYIFFHS